MKVKVVLLERMMHLGKVGDIVDVRRGYAANFLIPQKKALRASRDNIAYFKEKEEEMKARDNKAHQDALVMAEQLQGTMLEVLRQASESGQLYGSVSARDIIAIFKERDVTLSGEQILLEKRIKEIGIHPCRVAFHPSVIVDIDVNVARSESAAKAQEEEKRKQDAEKEELEKKRLKKQKAKQKKTQKKPKNSTSDKKTKDKKQEQKTKNTTEPDTSTQGEHS